MASARFVMILRAPVLAVYVPDAAPNRSARPSPSHS